MRKRDKQAPEGVEKTVRDIPRATLRRFSAREKIHIVLEGLRGEDIVAELCRKEGIASVPFPSLLLRGSKEPASLIQFCAGSGEPITGYPPMNDVSNGRRPARQAGRLPSSLTLIHAARHDRRCHVVHDRAEA